MGAWRSRPRTPDHPRSRGVYRAERIEDDEEFGSSPLARGLLLAEHPHREEDGIIPARAGFTRRRLRRRRRSRDHPRSRGVYTLTATGLGEQQGSSPLARGLRQMLILFCAGDGIIPARAGFTYKELSLSDFCVGSSPLARGLPHRHRPRLPAGRIIPARAGFTQRRHRRGRLHGDHPRSRGVYSAISRLRQNSGGSSPLARGLRSRRPGGCSRGRIIPARAGFTELGDGRVEAGTDHPRSRGVYRCAAGECESCSGSSPLARGLHHPPVLQEQRHGIIPARAGFTL